ncbi:MAG: Spy0128 family protein [Anaerovoracaceae bacterium]
MLKNFFGEKRSLFRKITAVAAAVILVLFQIAAAGLPAYADGENGEGGDEAADGKAELTVTTFCQYSYVTDPWDDDDHTQKASPADLTVLILRSTDSDGAAFETVDKVDIKKSDFYQDKNSYPRADKQIRVDIKDADGRPYYYKAVEVEPSPDGTYQYNNIKYKEFTGYANGRINRNYYSVSSDWICYDSSKESWRLSISNCPITTRRTNQGYVKVQLDSDNSSGLDTLGSLKVNLTFADGTKLGGYKQSTSSWEKYTSVSQLISSDTTVKFYCLPEYSPDGTKAALDSFKVKLYKAGGLDVDYKYEMRKDDRNIPYVFCTVRINNTKKIPVSASWKNPSESTDGTVRLMKIGTPSYEYYSWDSNSIVDAGTKEIASTRLTSGNNWTAELTVPIYERTDSESDLEEIDYGDKNKYALDASDFHRGYKYSYDPAGKFSLTFDSGALHFVKSWVGFTNDIAAAIKVDIYANGHKVKTIDLSSANNWSADLEFPFKGEDGKTYDRYDEKGNEVVYDAVEVFPEASIKSEKTGIAKSSYRSLRRAAIARGSSLNQYYGTVRKTGVNTWMLLNMSAYSEQFALTSKASVHVNKVWSDSGNSANRPESIKVWLIKNGEKTDKSLILNAENNWQGDFTGLEAYGDPAKNDGRYIRNTYSVMEETDDINKAGYKVSYSTKDSVADPSVITYEKIGNWEIKYNFSTDITITNSKPAPEPVYGSMEVSGLKTFDGEKPAERKYTFVLKDKDGKILSTVQNDPDGRFTFDSVKYSDSDVGKKFTYTVSEEAGSEAGVIYDDRVYTVTAEPYKASDGSIKVRRTITCDGENAGAVSFNNRSEEQKWSGSLTLRARKKFDGKNPGSRKFTFVLRDSSGKTLSTAENDGAGNIVFSPISYDDDDIGRTFRYTVSEKRGSADKIIYDRSEYTVTAKPEKSSEHSGLIEVKTKITLDGAEVDSIVFRNKTSVITPKDWDEGRGGKTGPKTGDAPDGFMWALLAAAAAAGVLVLVLLKRDRRGA